MALATRATLYTFQLHVMDSVQIGALEVELRYVLSTPCNGFSPGSTPSRGRGGFNFQLHVMDSMDVERGLSNSNLSFQLHVMDS